MKEIQGFLSRNILRRRETTIQCFSVKYLEMLSESDSIELRRKVRKNKGVIQILVHPFFKEEEASQEYKNERDTFIRKALATGVPLVIFEEELAIHAIQRRVNSDTGTIYVVPTLPNDARPASMRGPGFNPYFMSSETVATLEHNAWTNVMNPLKALGVEYCVVGGRYMMLMTPESKHEKDLFEGFKLFASDKVHANELVRLGFFPEGCAGTVLRMLTVFGIDASVSPISSPTNSLDRAVRGIPDLLA